MELTINGQVYQFNFGMGFLRDVNKRIQVPVDNLKDVSKGIGLTPRATKELLDDYIDDPKTDIDKLFEDTLGFLRTANATKKTVAEIEKAVAAEKERQESLKKALEEFQKKAQDEKKQ